MACSRILVVSSLMLALVALGSAEGGLSWLSLEGRPYIDAASLAAHMGAKLDRTPDRVYLRTPGRVVTLTRGWARVEVDGKAVVLEAPVRVEQERWLVPEGFLRQVMPILTAGVPVPAAERPRAAVPAEQSRPIPAPWRTAPGASGRHEDAGAAKAGGTGARPAAAATPAPAAGVPAPVVATPTPAARPRPLPRHCRGQDSATCGCRHGIFQTGAANPPDDGPEPVKSRARDSRSGTGQANGYPTRGDGS